MRKCGWKSPNSKIGRKTEKSTGWPGVGLRTPLNGLGETAPLCETKGACSSGLDKLELPPNGGSALNCSSTSCSTGL